MILFGNGENMPSMLEVPSLLDLEKTIAAAFFFL